MIQICSHCGSIGADWDYSLLLINTCIVLLLALPYHFLPKMVPISLGDSFKAAWFDSVITTAQILAAHYVTRESSAHIWDILARHTWPLVWEIKRSLAHLSTFGLTFHFPRPGAETGGRSFNTITNCLKQTWVNSTHFLGELCGGVTAGYKLLD